MYAAGAKDYFDILSANAFGLGSPPDDPPNPGKLNFQRVLLERAVMERFGDQDKAVWILEYGWNAAPDWIPDSRLIWGRVTEQQQAEYTTRGIELARANWEWVGVISIWFFRQVGDIPPNNPEAYFRMVDADFSPRPVYFSVSGATKTLGVAGPGEYEETHPALVAEGDWVYQVDDNASAGQFMRSGENGTSASLSFYGQALDFKYARQPEGGRLYVAVDGRPVSGLPRDETGQSFLDQNSAIPERGIVTRIVDNLPLGQHVVEMRAEGDVNLDGFVVPQPPAAAPPWVAIGILGGAGVILLVLAATLRQPERAGHDKAIEES
jgi:hypothetical protein